MLYLALRQGEKTAIIAYRTEDASPFSGGAVPRGWPDACSILPAGELPAVLGSAYSVQPQRYGATAPKLVHTVGCDYLLSGTDPVVVSIEVGWVGATAAEAEKLFADLHRQAYTIVGDISGAGDEAFAEKTSGGYGSPDKQTLYMRVGCTILRVGSTGPPQILPELARKIASHVHSCAA